jgi:hypothetical protein
LAYYREEFNWKEFFHAFVSSAALAVALLISIWVIEYFNESLNLEILTKLAGFLETFWWVIVAFVLLISLWDYVYSLYKPKLKYAKPLIDSIGLFFGFWLIASLFYGLTYFVEPGNVAILFLTIMHDVFYQLNILLFLLFLFISYGNFLLKTR